MSRRAAVPVLHGAIAARPWGLALARRVVPRPGDPRSGAPRRHGAAAGLVERRPDVVDAVVDLGRRALAAEHAGHDRV